jgi:fatty-acyl-CoA synthase/long-chain acyl-CoA synthetase
MPIVRSFLADFAVALRDKPAVIDDRPGAPVTTWSFAELNRQANRLAHVLLGLGVKPGEKVIWCGPNSPGVLRAVAALPKIGAVMVPLNYRFTPDEAAYVVGNSDAVVVYADAEHAGLLGRIRDAVPRVRHFIVFGGPAAPGMLSGEALLARASDAEPEVDVPEGTPGSMLYTSGTTGRPKGAVRMPADPGLVRPLLELCGNRPEDVYITTGPLYHSGPLGYMGLGQRLGNTVVLQRRFDAEDWLRLVAKYRVSMTFSAPAPIRMICGLPDEVKRRHDVSSMKRMVANAAPWSMALKEAYMRDFGEDSLWEVYGSTELGVDTVLAPADHRKRPGSCGRAVPGVEIRLYDEAGNEITEPDMPGEVFVRSANTFNGYYKADSATRAAQRGDFASVGDIAYRDADGYYYICDRKTDMIISGGMNIYPAEIEAALERHPDIADVAVFGIPSEEWGESVHAVVVTRAGRTLAPDAVTAFAREHLAGYKTPRSVSFVAEIPRTGSGKILKRVLREPFWQGRRARVS